jgi:hypothetical protein
MTSSATSRPDLVFNATGAAWENRKNSWLRVPLVMLSDHRAAGHIQRRGEAGRAVPHIVMVHPAVGVQQRRAWGGPVQRLDLARFSHAQHQRLAGRIQVQADDVADPADELRVTAELPGLD